MTTKIGMLLFPELTQLDLTAPHEVLSRMPNAAVSLLWKTLDPIRAGRGLTLLPTATLAGAGQLDVLVVPGGPGIGKLLQDRMITDFLRQQAAHAQYLTAVCTGSLLLGAAGLLGGYRATTHWAYHELLECCGAIPVRQRVVLDRNRITAGGVTAGIDFGLRLVAELRGDEVARGIQLGLEYDPEPPFDSGSPECAAPELVAILRAQFEPAVRDYRAQLTGRG